MRTVQRAVVVIHGKGGSPDDAWIPWLQKQVSATGAAFVAPKFPAEAGSKLVDWFKVFEALPLDLSKSIMIGHSRGAMALLRWIQRLPIGSTIGTVIIVSCNYPHQPHRIDSDEFYAHQLDYKDLQAKCSRYIVIHSADDAFAPIAAGEQLAIDLSAHFVRYETAGHFGSEKIEAPEIFNEIPLDF